MIDETTGFFLVLLGFVACSKYITEPEQEPEYLPDWVEIKGKSIPFSTFFEIFFLNDHTGFISGVHGALLKTTDGGHTWQELETGFDFTIFRVRAFDENTFAVLGNRLVGITKDQGATFSQSTLKFITDIRFINDQVWFAIGGRVYKTMNGGADWNVIYEPYIVRTHWYFMSDSTFYLYGGDTWREGDWPPGPIFSKGFLTKTTNGGSSFVDFEDENITSEEILNLSFLNELVGYFVNRLGERYKTTDGGYHWNLADSTEVPIRKILYTSRSTGYYAENTKLYKTIDGGRSWTIDLNLDSLEFFIAKIIKTENYLYLLQEEGIVFKKSIE